MKMDEVIDECMNGMDKLRVFQSTGLNMWLIVRLIRCHNGVGCMVVMGSLQNGKVDIAYDHDHDEQVIGMSLNDDTHDPLFQPVHDQSQWDQLWDDESMLTTLGNTAKLISQSFPVEITALPKVIKSIERQAPTSTGNGNKSSKLLRDGVYLDEDAVKEVEDVEEEEDDEEEEDLEEVEDDEEEEENGGEVLDDVDAAGPRTNRLLDNAKELKVSTLVTPGKKPKPPPPKQ
eukprot:TRINITY_DN10602_c0_g1_i2.p1 TRINITY_DN10602_c0_g1~~TRINITY_DN10602_c0_g1_i2.p1  ORF type:complete len:231 (-),score=94.57 TRINITY_DN10602_c0_g1_i2:275-967(-)